MLSILKQSLKLAMYERQVLKLPVHGKILSAQLQKGVPTIWYLNDNNDNHREVGFVFVWTGRTPPTDGVYISTMQDDEGLVWHLFQVE